jgi:electron transfer flavoprotein beta subunit
MDILVPIKLVPDLVEELEIDAAGTALDRRFMRLIPSEQDEHALEEALLLKERHGATVTVVALETGDVDEALYTAIAKGADRAVKVTGGDFEEGVSSHAASAVLQGVSKDLKFDLILTGVQATDDLDGSVGPLLAARLGLPFVGYVLAVGLEDGRAVARKEYPGGLAAEMEVALPAVLGIAAAEKPPRYVVTSLVMQAMKTATIEVVEAGEVDTAGAGEVARMYLPESGARAEMIQGGVDQVADALVALFQKRGLLG